MNPSPQRGVRPCCFLPPCFRRQRFFITLVATSCLPQILLYIDFLVSGASSLRWFSWLTSTESPSGWGAGCWLCNFAQQKTAWGQFAVCTKKALKLKNILTHATRDAHVRSLELFQKQWHNQAENPQEDLQGLVSGIGEDVPRLDRYLAAAGVVADHGSYLSYERRIETQGVASGLETGGKGNQSEARKILASLAGPLNEATLKAMKRAICSSIALDKSADILLVIGRLLLPEGVYDCILGLEMDVGPQTTDIKAALQSVLQRACVLERGPRREGSIYASEEDSVDQVGCKIRSKICFLSCQFPAGGFEFVCSGSFFSSGGWWPSRTTCSI